MEICGDCAWRDGTHCSSPLAKFNGGEGLEVRFPQGWTAHFLCNPRSASGYYTSYPGPAISCAGREEVEAAGERTAAGELVQPVALGLALFEEE